MLQYSQPEGPKREMWNRDAVQAYRETQDKIHSARGGKYAENRPKPSSSSSGSKNRHFEVNGDRLVRGASAGGLVAAGGYGAKKYRDKKKVSKGLDMNEGVKSLVSKMGPDPSELHVQGASGHKKKLRKLPPNAVRR